MSGASTSTYPENLGSGGQLPAELRAEFVFFCFFLSVFFVCPSRYDARHRKPRRFVYALNLGGTGISLPYSFSYRSNFCFRSSFRSRFCSRSSSSSSSTTSGDIFYCSGSRQLNHSSCRLLLLLLLQCQTRRQLNTMFASMDCSIAHCDILSSVAVYKVECSFSRMVKKSRLQLSSF